MSNNGFGTQVTFAVPGSSTTTGFTGSITGFTIKNMAEAKEATDGTDNFIGVAFSKRKKVATLEYLIYSSGSAQTLPLPGYIATMIAPWSGDVSGNWGVTGNPEITAKADDFIKGNVEVTQWILASGSTLP